MAKVEQHGSFTRVERGQEQVDWMLNRDGSRIAYERVGFNGIVITHEGVRELTNEELHELVVVSEHDQDGSRVATLDELRTK